MKRIILLSIVLVLAALSMPMVIASPPQAVSESPEPEAASAAPVATPEVPAATVPPDLQDSEFRFVALIDGETETCILSEYLPGALAGEMPASFEAEALKAQAVAARTYIISCSLRNNPKHPEADVCNDPGCCKTYIRKEALESMWGDKFQGYWESMCRATAETDGVYLSWEGEPIQAVFHSSSSGKTEDSANLWREIPYLKSVESPETSEDVPNFVTTVEVTIEDFKRTVTESYPELSLDSEPSSWIGESENYDSGRTAYLVLGGNSIPGSELRSMFGLRSTAFTLEFTGESFLFTVEGYGHGVGLSQYGANVMAKTGAGYREILLHYYPGTELAGR